MQRLRLEELLRIAVIAISAVLLGTAAAFVAVLVNPSEGTSIDDTLPVLVLTFLGICLVGIPAAVVAGVALHLTARSLRLPRLALLPLFLMMSTLTAYLLTERWHGLLPMTISAGIVGWALYCFGPVRLLGFEFSPTEHSDF